MPINIAARRGAKNQRRKAIVAQKRREETEASTTAGRVRAALADPIQQCLLSEGLFEVGVGTLIVARGATPYSLTMTSFMLDIFAQGVRDCFLASISAQELTGYLDRISSEVPILPVDPGYARKLLHDLTAWARTLGYPPHRDYPKLESIFGTVTPASDVEFRFGFNGKPLLVADLSDEGQVTRVLRGAMTIDADDVMQPGE